MRRTLPLLVGLIVAASALPSAAATRGSFNVDCLYSHSLTDDPIVAPGVPGGSHLHDFFGNRTTNAASTYETMRAGTTACRLLEDTGGYWNPTAYLGGAQVAPIRVAAYYFGVARGSVKTFPAGLQMLAGNPRALSAAENPAVTWTCGHAGTTPVASHPYDCTPYRGRVTARIAFPSCWNGGSLGPSSVTYPTRGKCPVAFTQLPKLSYRVRWRIANPCLGAVPCTAEDAPDENIQLSLSSGPYYTMHADFWNTWDQGKLETIVGSCLNAHMACGEQRTP